MRNFTLVTVLLLHSLGWIAVSVNEYMEVHPGENVTLMCSNYSSFPTQISWFRAVKKSKVACISYMFQASEPATFCEGFQNGKFEMSSNTSTLFLRIKHVDLSDSGLYTCGFYRQGYQTIRYATNLEVQGKNFNVPERSAKLMSVILGALTLFLTIDLVQIKEFTVLGLFGLAIIFFFNFFKRTRDIWCQKWDGWSKEETLAAEKNGRRGTCIRRSIGNGPTYE
uniref:Ig-like domain-containing protein n=1 Tax=Amphiprion ocellaris TaxID=80972 RepID=A0A3Q1AV22_AMPOC